MPSFAQFVTFKPDPFTLYSPQGQAIIDGDHDFPSLAIDNETLDTKHNPVLAFSYRTVGVGRLTMDFNGQRILEYVFFQPIPNWQVWQEILPLGLLVPSNQLAIAVGAWVIPGAGRVDLSDFVLTYHASA